MAKGKFKPLRRAINLLTCGLSGMVKRCKDGRTGTRYTFDDDSDDENTSSPKVPELEKHRHVDYCYDNSRPRVRVSHLELPRDVSKRRRASSAPPAPVPPSALDGGEDELFATYQDGVDRQYQHDSALNYGQERPPRRRTAGVSLVCFVRVPIH